MSTEERIVNIPNKNHSPHPPDTYGKSTLWSTRWHHQANIGESSLEAEMVRAFVALPNLRSKQKIVAAKWRLTHFLSNEDQAQWIKEYVDSETAVARKRVEDVETATVQEQEVMRNAENVELTTRKPNKPFLEMLNAVADSVSDLAFSDYEEDGDDEEEHEDDAELGKLSKDDEPGWVMCTISKMVPHRLESFRQKEMRHDQLTQPGWGDVGNNFRWRDIMYWTAQLKNAAVVKPQTDQVAGALAPTTCWELLERIEIVLRKSRMPPGTSEPRSWYMRPGSGKPLWHKRITSLPPSVAPN